MIISEEIKRLHDLHQAGALTDAEFSQAKAKVLSQLDLGKPGMAPPAGASSDLVQEFRRLRRSRTDRWLGGVCGGLGHISGMESWIWRIVFVMFTLTFGFGLAIYILLWIFVPDEESRIL
jgi:phage shock protein C